jgi:hypothetical protein
MHKVGDVLFMIVVVAALLVLTRPGSQAPGVIQSLGSGFAGAIQAATTGRAPGRVR